MGRGVRRSFRGASGNRLVLPLHWESFLSNCQTTVSDSEILWSTRYEKSVTMPQKVTVALYGTLENPNVRVCVRKRDWFFFLCHLNVNLVYIAQDRLHLLERRVNIWHPGVVFPSQRWSASQIAISPGVNTCPTHPWNVASGIALMWKGSKQVEPLLQVVYGFQSLDCQNMKAKTELRVNSKVGKMDWWFFVVYVPALVAVT